MKTASLASHFLGALLAASGLMRGDGADALETWRLLHLGGPALRDVDSRAGLRVAVGGDVLTSADEVTWTSATVAKTGFWEAGPYSVAVKCIEVESFGGRWVVFGTCTVPAWPWGTHEGVFASSPDGRDWSVTTAYGAGGQGSGWLRLAGTSGLLLAYGGVKRPSQEYGVASRTTNGTTWQTIALPANCAPLRDVCFGGPVMVMVGGDPLGSLLGPNARAQVLTSSSGVEWTFAIQANGPAFHRVAWGNSRYVLAQEGGAVGVSGDGLVWSFRPVFSDTSYPGQPLALAFGNGQFLLLVRIPGMSGGPTTQRLLRSADGVEWTEITLPTLDLWEDLAYGAGCFVAAGERGALFTSPDGSRWTPRESGVTNRLNAVRYRDRRFLVVGEEGVVLSSATIPLALKIVRASPDGPITLSWTGGGILEQAAAVTGPWTPVAPPPDASTYSLPAAGAARFFRLVDESVPGGRAHH